MRRKLGISASCKNVIFRYLSYCTFFFFGRIVDVLDVEVLPAEQLPMPPRTIYTLPAPPLALKLSMEKHERGKLFKHRRQLIHWLYEDLKSYSMQVSFT